MERSSNETLTLSAGHIKVYKVWDGQSGEEAAGFHLTLALGLMFGGRCGWLHPVQTSATHTQPNTHSRQHFNKWKLAEHKMIFQMFCFSTMKIEQFEGEKTQVVSF